MTSTHDLERALADMGRARRELLAVVEPLTAAQMGAGRPGGWEVARVLAHVVESEAIYVKVLGHLCSRATMAVDVGDATPADGASAARMLGITRAAVVEAVKGIDEVTLYALQGFGREEYSALSVLENIAAHDRDHAGQIQELLAAAPVEGGDAKLVLRGVHPGASGAAIRVATMDDLPAIVEIYNHYVINTAVTFDIEPVTVEGRQAWFGQFGATGRHRLWVAEVDGRVAGYAGTMPFRTKAAYETTVETTIYLAPDACGRGIGREMYELLIETMAGEDVRMMVGGVTLPNAASVALHERFGFELVGVFHAVGRKFGRYWDVGWWELGVG